MGGFWRFLKSIFGPDEAAPAMSPEALRAEFRAKYYNFKLLLTANTRTMGLMADLEEALHGSRIYGLPFVRATTTALAVGVFRMIKCLEAIAPGRYQNLHLRFKDLQANIEAALKRPGASVCAEFTLPFSVIDSTLADQVGSKMAGLGDIRNLGLPVPDGFAVTACAFHRFMEHQGLGSAIEQILADSDTSDLRGIVLTGEAIKERILAAPMPEDLARAIEQAYRDLEARQGQEVRVSLRGSPLGEGLAGRSFAGQFRGEMNVGPEDLLEAYKRVLAGKYGTAALNYRLRRGIPDEDVAIAVGITTLVAAVAGGVACSRNPLDLADDSVHIESAWGLPKTVAEGTGDSDQFVVRRGEAGEVVTRSIAHKPFLYVCDPRAGTSRYEPTEERADLPSLTDQQAVDLARLVQTLEQGQAAPVDLEWALAEDGIFSVLRCRPLTRAHVRGQAVAPRTEPPGPVLLSAKAAASPGKGSGPVFIVRQSSDISRFPEGAVLVAVNALPKWAALMDKAVAVITEHGSTAGNLADSARELGVPAIFGADEASRVLAEGQIVTVDADGLTVYQGRLESLLSAPREPARGMLGTPVGDILDKAAAHITPLTLTDPDTPTFRPRHCQTLHDIARFCHEKAVQEMFSFGQEHEFSELAAKQIYTDAATQWWVINLDDGFKHEVPGKFVRIEEINSLPLLAVWEGINAFAWAGPPPINARGLMSIMYESTTNPDLLTTSQGNFSARNYFLVSRQYVSLSSRFGYHFTTIEGLVGDRPSENYICFQFRGGAAEAERRTLRIHFVTELVERYGFGLEMKGDSLFARIEGRDCRAMVERLMILGYIIIHTRQLDMIMKLPAEVRKHKEKIHAEIAIMLGRSELLAGLPEEACGA